MNKALRVNLLSQEFISTARQLEVGGVDLAMTVVMIRTGLLESGICSEADFAEGTKRVAQATAEVLAENPELFPKRPNNSPSPKAN